MEGMRRIEQRSRPLPEVYWLKHNHDRAHGFRARADARPAMTTVVAAAILAPHNLRHPGRRRGVAAALGADDAVDDGHADAGAAAELPAVEQVLAGGMLCDRCNNSGHPAKSC